MADPDRPFGDADPEDSWDPDDPPAALVRNIRRRLELVRRSLAGVELEGRVRQRLELALDDLDLVHRRLLEDAG